jgi:GxxExxY protein
MHVDRKEKEAAPEAALTEKILAAAFKVQNTLGCGFLEKVYENALAVELAQRELPVEQQKALKVLYEGAVVGDYQADLVVDGRVLVECKAVSTLDPVHEAQLLNYLKVTGIRVGLLLNFARPKLHYRRFVV